MGSGHLDIKREIAVGAPVTDVVLSLNGQYVAAVSEQGTGIFATFTGGTLFTHPPERQPPLPMQKIVATPAMDRLYFVTRQGEIAQLDVSPREGEKWQGEVSRFYAAVIRTKDREGNDKSIYDLYSLSLSADGALLALGHHSPGLTLLKTSGEVVWRRHRDTGNATEGQGWAVCFAPDSATLYIASSGVGVNRIAAMNPLRQSVSGGVLLEPGVRVVDIAVLAGNAGLATVQVRGRSERRMVVYTADLSRVMWQEKYYEPVTALAASRELTGEGGGQEPLLAVSLGVGGQINVLNALSGEVLAEKTLRTLVNDLDFVQGATLAAATQDGYVVSIAYVSEKGFVL